MLKRILAFFTLIPVIASCPDSRAGGQKSLFLGTIYGSGRACSGRFTVTEKWITWQMHFNKCIRMPYKIIKQDDNDQHKFVVFELDGESACPFPTITMEQRPELNGGWEIRGYSKGQSYEHDLEDMDCLLY